MAKKTGKKDTTKDPMDGLVGPTQDKDKAIAPPKAKPPVVTKPFKHDMPVKCNDPELVKLGKELAKCHGTLDHIDMLFQEAKKKAAADREPINTRISELLKTLDTGERLVNTRCQRVLDYNDGMVTFVRSDTGAIFHERKMNHDEQQRMFSFFNPEFDITY